MIWRPASVRSFRLPIARGYSSIAAKTGDPLRILFCGSDDFSIASLRALHHAKQSSPDLIESIDVVHRPAKPTGRGLKDLRQVPIQATNEKHFRYEAHVIDTFTGWTPPLDYNLVVAVSFGLLVPRRILDLAQYGGLNVHPSLLPDLRGAAPIHHTLLKRRSHAGVSVQTLHPQHFDRGMVLAQSSAPGLLVDYSANQPLATLTERLGEEGGSLLVQVLKSRAFVPPLTDVGWYAATNGSVDHAEKITKQHSFVDFATRTVDDLKIVSDVLESPWCLLRNGERLILDSWTPVEHVSEPPLDDFRGIWVDAEGRVMARLACGAIVEITACTYPGGKTGKGNAKVKAVYGWTDKK